MENTRVKTDIPPCERGFGCCHNAHCVDNGDACQQFTAWQATGYANFNMNREPKKLIKKINKIRQSDVRGSAVRMRQDAIHKILVALSFDQLKLLAPIVDCQPSTLKSNRFRGLSMPFIEKMESPQVKNFLAKQGEAA